MKHKGAFKILKERILPEMEMVLESGEEIGLIETICPQLKTNELKYLETLQNMKLISDCWEGSTDECIDGTVWHDIYMNVNGAKFVDMYHMSNEELKANFNELENEV